MNPEAAQKPCGALGSRGGKEPIRRGALHDSAVIEEQHILAPLDTGVEGKPRLS